MAQQAGRENCPALFSAVRRGCHSGFDQSKGQRFPTVLSRNHTVVNENLDEALDNADKLVSSFINKEI